MACQWATPHFHNEPSHWAISSIGPPKHVAVALCLTLITRWWEDFHLSTINVPVNKSSIQHHNHWVQLGGHWSLNTTANYPLMYSAHITDYNVTLATTNQRQWFSILLSPWTRLAKEISPEVDMVSQPSSQLGFGDLLALLRTAFCWQLIEKA